MKLRDAIAAVAAGDVVQKKIAFFWEDMRYREVLDYTYKVLTDSCNLDTEDPDLRLKPLYVTLNGTEYSVQKSCLTSALQEEFYFNGDGKVYSRTSQLPSKFSQGRTQFGNRFATREAAETAVSLVKVLLETMKGC